MVAVVACSAGEGQSLLVVKSAISMGGGGMATSRRSFFLGGGVCVAPFKGLAGGMKTSSVNSPAKRISRRVTMASLHPWAAAATRRRRHRCASGGPGGGEGCGWRGPRVGGAGGPVGQHAGVRAGRST